ncbi:MAG: lipid A export permease/ATP-binding protein MsbA [Acidiferrobacteraceae bacterium]
MSQRKPLASGFSLYWRLLRYTRDYKLVLLLSVLALALSSGGDVGLSALVRPLFDEGFIGKKPEAILWVPVALVAVVALRGIATFLGTYGMNWVGRKIVYRIRNELFDRMVYLPTRFFVTHPGSTLISKLIYDVQQIQNAATSALFVLIQNSLKVIGLLGWMVYLDWKLTLLFAVLAPVLAFLVRAMGTRMRKISHRIQNSMGEISRVAGEAVDGERVVKAFNAQEAEKHKFERANNHNRQQAMKMVLINAGGTPLLEIVGAVVMAVVLRLILDEVASAQYTTGAAASYFTAMMLIMQPARTLSNVNQTLQKGIAASHSAFSVLDEIREEDKGGDDSTPITGRIEYRNVGFRYPGSDMAAIEDVSFSTGPGELVALVGASGSGKTTLATLLARYYTLDTGSILIDGVAIQDYRLSYLRRHLALVSQDIFLFDDSIRGNIAYGEPGEIDHERLMDAARSAHVLEFAERLPEGLDTRVGEKGMLLSGGQRQRVAIARAMYKNAPILILDEATSALDPETERKVQDALNVLTAHRTTLVIAHRLSTIERADRIIVMDQGRVAETGSHAELLESGGIYAGFYRTQLQPTD